MGREGKKKLLAWLGMEGPLQNSGYVVGIKILGFVGGTGQY